MSTTYAEFVPTCFDQHIKLEGREDWLVVTVGRHRDSGCLDESNFNAAVEILGGESDTVEIHRFGHWGHGWFEILIAAPERKQEVEGIASSLENYPVLDDEDHSQREYEAMQESWDSWGAREFERDLLRSIESLAEEADGAESDIERELRKQSELDEFMPDGGMTWRMAGQKPPTPSERLYDRMAEVESWSSDQLRKFYFETCDGEYETSDDGASFSIGKAVKKAISEGLFWDDPRVA